MTRLAFCDDDPNIHDQLTALLEKYRTQRKADLECTAFRSPLDLLAAIESGARYDILLLDVLMPAEDGITAAKVDSYTIRVTGTATADTAMTLTAPTEKTAQTQPPTGLTVTHPQSRTGYGRINGTVRGVMRATVEGDIDLTMLSGTEGEEANDRDETT